MNGNFKSLTEFAQEIERIEKTKNDYLVPHESLKMESDEILEVKGTGHFEINDVAHQQISSKLGIPKKYYDSMGSISGLRTTNVNAWLEHTPEQSKFIRTLDNSNRAFLSDKFRPLDNTLILQPFLDSVTKYPDLQVKSQSLTEKKMYLQVVFPSLQAEVVKGDIVQSGLILTNSEVGWGSVNVQQVVWRLVCSNGMIGQSVVNQYHVGRRVGSNESDYSIFQSDTIQADINSFHLKLRDVFSHVLTEASFVKQVNELKKAAGDKIENPVRVVENITQRFGLSDREKEGITNNLMKDGDMTRWGLANSLTAMAHTIENIERQYDFEKMGHDVIQLKPSEWELVSVA